MQLPPKRFQPDWDTKYDSIRWKPWFLALHDRRKKIPLLESAMDLWADGLSQKDSASTMGVDERELRDFLAFRGERSRFAEEPAKTQRLYQMLLDQAYDSYRDSGAAKSFTDTIYEQSEILGINGRPVVELWDIDPKWYPTQYRGVK